MKTKFVASSAPFLSNFGPTTCVFSFYASDCNLEFSLQDAHNCILNFDVDTSFFAVYDGHGGREVAAYCSQHLPDFLKQMDAYKVGDIETALVDAFLQFDATIITKEVVQKLKALINSEDESECDDDDCDGSEEDMRDLYEEAAMSIEQVVQKYTKNLETKYNGDRVPKVAKSQQEDCAPSSSLEALGCYCTSLFKSKRRVSSSADSMSSEELNLADVSGISKIFLFKLKRSSGQMFLSYYTVD